MREKQIAIYLVVTVLIFAVIIGVTLYVVTGKKSLKNNNTNQSQSEINQSVEATARTIEKTYENCIYKIDLYTDGTATAKIKPDIQLWGNMKTSDDENYKKEKEEFKSILLQSRQIDSNNKKIEQVFISKYIGDIYDNYNYGKAIIKCEGNVFYLIDLVSDKKIRIDEDWTEKCREVNSDKIELNLGNVCLAQVIEDKTKDAYAVFENSDNAGKYAYTISYKNENTYSLYIFLEETKQLIFYGLIENIEDNENNEYNKFNLPKPNGGSISGTIKQNNIISDTSKKESNKVKQDDSKQESDKVKTDETLSINKVDSIFLELTDISSASEENYSTNGYIELKNKK